MKDPTINPNYDSDGIVMIIAVLAGAGATIFSLAVITGIVFTIIKLI